MSKTFQWTDELVAEYSLNSQRMTIFEFKRSKEEPQRIEASKFNVHDTFRGNSTTSFWYQFCLSRPIQPEKYPAIKSAIENVLNGFSQEEIIKMGKDILMAGRYSEKDMEDCWMKSQSQTLALGGNEKSFQDYLQSLNK